MSEFKSKLVPIPLVRCQHIMCKGMGIFGEGYKTPEDESARTNDFWCEKTQTVLGPDGGLVMMSRCQAGRDCYQEL